MEIATYRLAEIGRSVVNKMDYDKALKLYAKSDEDRLKWASVQIAGLVANKYTEAQAQYIVFGTLREIHTTITMNTYMNSFAEKMREQLLEKLSAFGEKAYPLTEKQFAAAVKAAW